MNLPFRRFLTCKTANNKQLPNVVKRGNRWVQCLFEGAEPWLRQDESHLESQVILTFPLVPRALTPAGDHYFTISLQRDSVRSKLVDVPRHLLDLERNSKEPIHLPASLFIVVIGYVKVEPSSVCHCCTQKLNLFLDLIRILKLWKWTFSHLKRKLIY